MKSRSGTTIGKGDLSPDQLTDLLHARRWDEVEEQAEKYPNEVLVDLLRSLNREDRVLLFRALPASTQSDLFGQLSTDEQDQLFRELTDQDTRQLMNQLAPDERTALLEELPAEITEKALQLLDDADREECRELLGYPEHSVGRVMTTNFVSVRPDWSVERTLEYLRNLDRSIESISSIYVTDPDRTLLDDLPLRRLFRADPERTLTDLMDHTFVSIRANEDQETAVRVAEKYDLRGIPAVDSAGKLVGIITMDDLMEIAEEEASDDFHRLGGSEPLEQPYFDLSVVAISRKRVVWLLLLFLGGTLTSSVIGAFEDQLNQVLILSFFIPLLIGTGGNAGAQSVSTIIRALALHEVHWEDTFRVIYREFLIGLLVGSVLGVLGYLFVTLFWGASPSVSLVVAFTLPVICTWSNVVAGIVPILADKVGIDPTVISAPLITTVVDTTGLVIYFSLAVWILRL